MRMVFWSGFAIWQATIFDRRRINVRDLTEKEVDLVCGGSEAADITMILASGWAGAVAGFAAGSLVPGAGNFVGAGVGLGVGVLSGVGYTLASPDTPVVDGLRGGIGGGNVTIREVPSGGAELNTLDGGS